MRTFVFKGILGLALLSGLGTVAAAAAAPAPVPFPADQARTMEEVTDRVVKAENQMNTDIRKYSPLVETYIQNLKPDTELGLDRVGRGGSWLGLGLYCQPVNRYWSTPTSRGSDLGVRLTRVPRPVVK